MRSSINNHMIYLNKRQSNPNQTGELIISISFVNDGNGLRAVDLTGNATVAPFTTGSASISTNAKYGSDAASLRMIGSAGGLRFTSSKSLNPRTDSYTIGGWLNAQGGSFQNFLGPTNVDRFYPIEYYGAFGAWFTGDGSSNVITYSDAAPPVGTWVHMALSHDAATRTFRMFKNGILVSSSSPPQLLSTDITQWEMGARTAVGLYGTGYYGRLTVVKGSAQSTNFTPS